MKLQKWQTYCILALIVYSMFFKTENVSENESPNDKKLESATNVKTIEVGQHGVTNTVKAVMNEYQNSSIRKVGRFVKMSTSDSKGMALCSANMTLSVTPIKADSTPLPKRDIQINTADESVDPALRSMLFLSHENESIHGLFSALDAKNDFLGINEEFATANILIAKIDNTFIAPSNLKILSHTSTPSAAMCGKSVNISYAILDSNGNVLVSDTPLTFTMNSADTKYMILEYILLVSGSEQSISAIVPTSHLALFHESLKISKNQETLILQIKKM